MRNALLAALLCTLPLSARAVDLEQWKPAPGADDVLAIQSAHIGGPTDWHALLATNYANRPFRLVRSGSGSSVATVLSHQTALDVGGSWTWRNRFELGGVIPVMLNQNTGGAHAADPTLPASVPATALGDLRVVGKVPLWDRRLWAVAIGMPLSLPTASRDAFTGHDGVTVRPRVLATRAFGSHLELSGNGGLVLRGDERFRNFDQSTALDLGAAAVSPFKLLGEDLEAILTAGAEWGVTQHGQEERPVELLGAMRWRSHPGLELTLGGGHGFSTGAGTPDYRVFLELGWRGERHEKLYEFDITEKPPEEGEVRLERDLGKIVTSPVHFASGRDVILEESFPILDKVAATLKANPWIRKVRVEGHTDSQGNPKYNLDLSQLRAISVAKFLVQKGVEPDILVPVGYGITRPIVPNDTAANRARNRRVDFIILEADDGTTFAPDAPSPTPTPASK